jgi:hypothetical protein
MNYLAANFIYLIKENKSFLLIKINNFYSIDQDLYELNKSTLFSDIFIYLQKYFS